MRRGPIYRAQGGAGVSPPVSNFDHARIYLLKFIITPLQCVAITVLTLDTAALVW